MAIKENFIDGMSNPDIQAQVSEMAEAYERRLAAGRKLAELIAGLGREVSVDFATYFAHINQLSLEEAKGEHDRKIGYYYEMFNGVTPENVGEPVLITSLTLVHEMGMIGSFTEGPNPIRYIVGANSEGNRWGRIELAFRELEITPTSATKPTFSEKVKPVAVADETAHRRHEGRNISTDRAFRTKLYIGQQGVQEWVDIKFPGIGDTYVEPLMEALEVQSVA
jgi:hypothetical protein